jgi:hypothetical protein
MCAEMALGGGAFIGIDINGVVRASLHARFATDAALGTEINNAVLALVHRRDRTDGNAWRLLTMIAAGDLKNPSGVGKFSLLYILDPGPVYAQCDLILRFAGHGAGMAADALAVINDETIFHRGSRASSAMRAMLMIAAWRSACGER